MGGFFGAAYLFDNVEVNSSSVEPRAFRRADREGAWEGGDLKEDFTEVFLRYMPAPGGGGAEAEGKGTVEDSKERRRERRARGGRGEGGGTRLRRDGRQDRPQKRESLNDG